MFALVMHPVTMIDYDGPVPVYRQVAEILKGRIADGTYQAGRRLPSVTGLTQEFGIAQLTARKALRVLVDEGLAEMTPGMGTYVKQQESQE
jgi:GntR family transcriptional regulator